MTKRRIEAGDSPENDPDILDVEPVDEEFDEQDEADEIALSNAISELGDSGASGKVVVHKEDAAKRNMYINTYDVGIFNDMGLNGLRSEFGAGTYHIRVYNGRGRLVKGGNRKITMAQIEQDKPKAAPAPDFATVLRDALIAMQQQSEQQIARLAEALRPPPAPTMGEMLQNMVYMKQVMGMDAPRSDGGIDMFLKAVQVAREISPPSGEATGADVFLELAKQFAPVIAQNARAQTPQQPRSPKAPAIPIPPNLQRNIAPGNPAPEPLPAQTPIIQPSQDDDMSMMFKMQLKMMVRSAQAGSPPENFVDLILDNFDDDTLEEFLNDPNALQKLASIEPTVTAVMPWFEKLRALIIDATTEEAPDEGLTIPPFPESNEEHE